MTRDSEITYTLRAPTAILNGLEVLLLALAVWCLFPPLLLGRHDVELPLLFGQHLTGDLTPKNLAWFWLLLFTRVHLRQAGGSRSWAVRLYTGVSSRSVTMVMFLVVLLVYLNAAMNRMWPSGDTVPAKLIPISILEEGDLDLDEFRNGVWHTHRYGFRRVDGREFASYPIAPALTALPVYALGAVLFPDAFASWRGAYSVPAGDSLPNVANLLEQWAAAIIAALCVMMFWLICRDVTGDSRLGLWIVAAVGFGTSLMSTASLALWQHGPACLSLCLLVLALRAAEKGRCGMLGWAGLAAGWAYACRPSMLVVVGLVTVWTFVRFKRRAWAFLCFCIVAVIPVMAYNYSLFGSLAGGYARNTNIFTWPDWCVGLTLLFSPSRGLFFFSPFLLFALPGLYRACRHPFRIDGLCAYGAIGTILFFSCWGAWAGGSCFGSRFLCEAAVLLAVVLAYHTSVLARGRLVGEVFLLSVIFSCHLHILGATRGDAGWTQRVFKGNDLAAAWRWSESQAVWTLARPEKQAEALPSTVQR